MCKVTYWENEARLLISLSEFRLCIRHGNVRSVCDTKTEKASNGLSRALMLYLPEEHPFLVDSLT